MDRSEVQCQTYRLIDICISILYFRDATNALDRVNYVSLFLSDLLAHGSFPAELLLRMPTPLLLCTVTSILEGNNINLTYFVNYRGIALSSVYDTILDLIILWQYADKFCTSELQFEFERKRFTNMSTMVSKETLSYYVNNGVKVFFTFLDASNALTGLIIVNYLHC